MAKSKSVLIRLKSSAKTGIFYVRKKKTSDSKAKKLVLKKYDKKIRKRVDFVEDKI